MYLLANNFIDFINGLYKFVDYKEEAHGEKIMLYCHDKYSLPFSTHAKIIGSVFTDFFTSATVEVEDYMVGEIDPTDDLLLWYEVKSENKRYVRRINKDGKVIEEK